MPRKMEGDRLEKQRLRQQELRKSALAAKRPSRDDVARVALFSIIRRMADMDAQKVLNDFQDKVVGLLAEQGFDEKASDEVFEDLVRKYKTGGLPFRRKVHLLYPDGPPDGSEDDS